MQELEGYYRDRVLGGCQAAQGATRRNPMELVKCPIYKKTEGHRALEGWERNWQRTWKRTIKRKEAILMVIHWLWYVDPFLNRFDP